MSCQNLGKLATIYDFLPDNDVLIGDRKFVLERQTFWDSSLPPV